MLLPTPEPQGRGQNAEWWILVLQSVMIHYDEVMTQRSMGVSRTPTCMQTEVRAMGAQEEGNQFDVFMVPGL